MLFRSAMSAGLPFCGLKPRGRLKFWIFQSEDSPRRVAQDRIDVRAELKEQYPDVDWDKTGPNVRVVRLTGKVGPAFVESLDSLLSQATGYGERPDVIVLNPFLAFVGGPVSDGAYDLHINVPTGKDSLSMTQKYPDGTKVISPGTVIVSAGGEVSDIRKVVSPVMVNNAKSSFYHVDFSFDALRLGGSAFAQTMNCVGDDVPTVKNPEYFAAAFNAVQMLVNEGIILAGHDISAGGLITTLLEMCFANVEGGMEIDFNGIAEGDIVKLLFAENPGLVIQVADADKAKMEAVFEEAGVCFMKIGTPSKKRQIAVAHNKRTRLRF